MSGPLGGPLRKIKEAFIPPPSQSAVTPPKKGGNLFSLKNRSSSSENLLDESLVHEERLAKSSRAVLSNIEGISVSLDFHNIWSKMQTIRDEIFELDLLVKLRGNRLGRPKQWHLFLVDLFFVYDGLEVMVKEKPDRFPVSSLLFDQLQRGAKLSEDIMSYGITGDSKPGKGAKWCSEHLSKVCKEHPDFLELHLFVFYYFLLFHGENTKLWIQEARKQWDYCANVGTSVYDFEDSEALKSQYIAAFDAWIVDTALFYYEKEDILTELKNAFILYAHLLEAYGDNKRDSIRIVDMALADLT